MVVRGRMGHGFPQTMSRVLSSTTSPATTPWKLKSLAEVVGVVVAAGLFIPEEVDPELGLRHVPRRAVVEGHPFPQVKSPPVGTRLFPTLDSGQSHHLEVVQVIDPGQRVANHVVADGVLDIPAAIGAGCPNCRRLFVGNYGYLVLGAGDLRRRRHGCRLRCRGNLRRRGVRPGRRGRRRRDR